MAFFVPKSTVYLFGYGFWCDYSILLINWYAQTNGVTVMNKLEFKWNTGIPRKQKRSQQYIKF